MSGDVTIQALKRQTYLPERGATENGTLIAGQEYDDVYFAGGEANDLTLNDPIINDPVISGGTYDNPVINDPEVNGTLTGTLILSGANGGTGVNNGAATLTITGNAAVSGTNTGDVTLAGQNYLSIAGQVITANAVDLSGTNATGTLAAARFPALTGDVSTAAGNLTTTLATVNSNVGTFANATITLDAKGRATAAVAGYSGVPVATAGGTANAITATYSPAFAAYTDGMLFAVVASGGTTTTNPTIDVNGLGAKTIVKKNNQSLVTGDIAGQYFVALFEYNSSIDRAVLLNSAKVVVGDMNSQSATSGQVPTSNGAGSVSWTNLALASLATQAANTVVANATAGAAAPTAVALAASQLLGRGGSGNIAPITMGNGLSLSATALTNTGVVTVKHQIFTGSGTYTPSTGMIYCIVEALGGGAGGGGTAGGGYGGGGGSGGYAKSILTAADIGASQVVTIGAAGTAGTAGGANNGGSGGATSVGALVATGTATGGTGSAAGAVLGGAGGVPTAGQLQATGGRGQVGNAVAVLGGMGGQSIYGGGGTSGGNGTAYGGGGGGGANGLAGGAGSAGVVFITEFCSQ